MMRPAPQPTTTEYGIERLVPPWSTNPELPAGQPYRDGYVEGHYPTRPAAEAHCTGWAPGCWRIMTRQVTPWSPE